LLIIDTKLANVNSIYNMLKFLDIKAKISNDIDEIYKADKLIIPGVGSFDEGIKNLAPLKEVIIQKSKNTPLLGICLGMQVMCKNSKEGDKKGFGFFDVEVEKFGNTHIGWNCVDKNLYYFMHTYYVPVNKYTLSIAKFENIEFSAIIKKDNILGVQFHPEKSHKFGLQFFKDFNEI